MRTKKKVLLITLLVILASLVVVYAAGALFFSSHFYPNTRFNDEDISYQADTAFVDKVEAQVPGYKLTITEMTTSRTSLQSKSTSLLILKAQSRCVRVAKCLALAHRSLWHP